MIDGISPSGKVEPKPDQIHSVFGRVNSSKEVVNNGTLSKLSREPVIAAPSNP